MTGHPLVDTAVYLAGVLVALGTLWRYVIPGLRGLWHLVKGTEEFVESVRETGGFRGLHGLVHEVRAEVAEVKKLAQSSHRELHPNGGSSMRDTVNATAAGVHDLGEKADRLEGFASDNRQGIARLDRRVTDVQEEAARLGEKADALGQRQTDHRRRNDEQVAELRDYLENERVDLLNAKQGLEASVHELLMVEGHERREQSPADQPDHQPDL